MRPLLLLAAVMMLAMTATTMSHAGQPPDPTSASSAAPAPLPRQDNTPMPFAITSTAFVHGTEIPARFTCEGANVSPALMFRDVPAQAKSLAVIVHDPDAPDPKAPQRIWTHWVLFGLPPTTGGLVEGVTERALPTGARGGHNDWGRTGYGGPCPPIGSHRYFFTAYALDTTLADAFTTPPTRDALLEAMKGHVLASAVLLGTYEKKGHHRAQHGAHGGR